MCCCDVEEGDEKLCTSYFLLLLLLPPPTAAAATTKAMPWTITKHENDLFRQRPRPITSSQTGNAFLKQRNEKGKERQTNSRRRSPFTSLPLIHHDCSTVCLCMCSQSFVVVGPFVISIGVKKLTQMYARVASFHITRRNVSLGSPFTHTFQSWSRRETNNWRSIHTQALTHTPDMRSDAQRDASV